MEGRGVKYNETLALIGWVSLTRAGVTEVSTLQGMSSNRYRMIATEQLEVKYSKTILTMAVSVS